MLARPLFHPGNPQIAIKPIPYGEDSIPAGTDVSHLPMYQLRGFWRRFLIGEKGHPWTNWMLEMAGIKVEPEPVAKQPTQKPKRPRRKRNVTN